VLGLLTEKNSYSPTCESWGSKHPNSAWPQSLSQAAVPPISACQPDCEFHAHSDLRLIPANSTDALIPVLSSALLPVQSLCIGPWDLNSLTSNTARQHRSWSDWACFQSNHLRGFDEMNVVYWIILIVYFCIL
jgi:hypothetical protein